MKVLIVSYMVPEAPSGVSVHYMNLARSLRSTGHQADTISITGAPALVRYITSAVLKTLSYFGQLGNEIGREIHNLVRVYVALKLALRKNEYDLINAQDVGSAYAAKLASNGRIPVLLTCHFNDDPATENIQRRKLEGVAASFSKKWHRFLFKDLDYFNGVSSYVIKKSRHLFKHQAWVEVIHNGVDFKKIRLSSPLLDLQEKYPGKFIIMNIGHLEKRKNQRMLVEIAAIMKKKRQDFLVAIVGKGEDQQLLQQQIEQNDLTEHVAMLGHHDNVIPILKSADMYLHTALNENCPLVLLEAIAASVPSFALAVGGIPEIIKQRGALFHKNSSAEVLAEILCSLIDDPEQREAIRNSQYADGIKNFDIAIMTQKYLACYRRIMEDFATKHIQGKLVQSFKAIDLTYNPVHNK